MMFQSLKSRLILSSSTSMLFIIFIFIIFNSQIQISNSMINLFVGITLASVFNTGILTQKYLQSKNITIN